jgi:quercetin dioxygenase-like cupin family protein
MPKLIASPTPIGCVGSISKFANEFVGLVNTGNSKLSITRVQSPAGWVGVGQYADYHEYRLILSGMLHVEYDAGSFDAQAGQCVDIEPGEWVHYSSPEAGGADYVTVCLPAFSLATVHRDK